MKRPACPASGACRQVCLRMGAHFLACRWKCLTRTMRNPCVLARAATGIDSWSPAGHGGVPGQRRAGFFLDWEFFSFLEVSLRLWWRQRHFSAATLAFALPEPATL